MRAAQMGLMTLRRSRSLAHMNAARRIPALLVLAALAAGARAGVLPDRVVLNLTSTPATSMAVNWRTDLHITASTGQVAVAESGPDFKPY